MKDRTARRPTRGVGWLLLVASLAAACSRSDAPSAGGATSDSTHVTSVAPGDVSLDDGGRVHLDITSDQYRKWDAAQRALTAIPGVRLGSVIDPLHPTQARIDRAVAYLENNARARAAIEGAGLSVRDFLMTSVALAQADAAARGKSVGTITPPPAPAPSMPEASDTFATTPTMPPRVDTMPPRRPRPDTARADSAPTAPGRREPTPRDSVRPDSTGRREPRPAARPDTSTTRPDTGAAAPRG